MEIFLDTNVFLKNGFQEKKYYDIIKFSENNLIKIYTHELVIREAERRTFVELKKCNQDLQKQTQKFALKNVRIPRDETIKREVKKSVEKLLFKLHIEIINHSPSSFTSTLDDYFAGINAFEHDLLNHDDWSAKKKNFIDSIIAYDFLMKIKKSNNKLYFITDNMKDFKWIKNSQVSVLNYDAFFSTEREQLFSLLENVKKSNLILEILNHNKKQVSEAILNLIHNGDEYYDIETKKYDLNIDNSISLLLYTSEISNDNFQELLQFNNPIVSNKKENKGQISINFSITLNCYVRYCTTYSDLDSENIYSYREGASIKDQSIIEIIDDSGEGIIEIDHLSKIDITGWLELNNISLNIDKIDDLPLSKAKLILNEDKIELTPYEY